MPILLPAQTAEFQRYLGGDNGFMQWFNREVYQPVLQVFEGNAPKRLGELWQRAHKLNRTLVDAVSGPLTIDVDDAAILRRAALHYRHHQALLVERLHGIGVDAEHAVELDALTAAVERALEIPGVRDVAPLPRPRLTEYVNLKTAREILAVAGTASEMQRVYDEKFGILWGPSAFVRSIEAARRESWLLGTTTCVAYVDIDDFKGVNTRITETRVDREVLPPFMMRLEAHTSSRGYAFRYGGDEYVLVFPNADTATSLVLLEQLRKDIAERSFGGERLTVSIGFAVVPDDCPLTNSEILSRANTAKNAAKKGGKNRAERAEL